MSNMTTRRCSSCTLRVRDLVALIAAATGTTLSAVGCGSSGSTAPRTGSLTVTIAAPAGVTPSVTVSGPGGYIKALSATTTLTGLAAGNYAVTAAPVTTADTIVGTVNTAAVAGTPASVTAGATAATTATYVQRPGSGALWVGNEVPGTAEEYTATQLRSTTSADPATVIGAAGNSYGVAFDANGNLWVTLFLQQAVAEYTASQLSAGGTVTPAVTLSGAAGSLVDPTGLAFDAHGNLWVANFGDSSVVEFPVGQLASSGSPAPAVTISASSGSLSAPSGLAFDGGGNLWVANFGNGTMVEFTSTQLAGGGGLTPAVTISTTAGSLSSPLGAAFDANGDLWVANHADTVVEFTPSQLAGSGSPAPAVTLSSTGSSLSSPTALAFDAGGDLWVANVGSGIVQFRASQLVVSGSPTPNVTVTGSSLSLPFGLAFDPHAAGLPLKP
jgi:sugar lactone lactonase YvrE